MFTKKNFLFLFLFAVFVTLAVIVWAMNKGFNLSDEGFYIAGYDRLIEFPFWLSAFKFLTVNTFSKIGSGLIYFRIIRLVLTITGSLFLSFTLWGLLKKFNFIKNKNEKRTLISLSLFCLMGSLAGYGLGPQTLSYNHYTLFFGNLFLGLIFLGFTNSDNRKKNMLISAALGIVCGLEFFVKIPTTILLSFLFLSMQFILFKQLRWFSIINSFIFALFAILAFSFISFPSSPKSILNEYYYVISFISKFYTHDVNYVIKNYIVGFNDFWDSHLINYVPHLFFLVMSLIFSFQNKYLSIKKVGNFLFLLISTAMVYSLYSKGYFLSGSKHNGTAPLIYIIFIFLFSILFFFHFVPRKKGLLSDFFLEKIFAGLALLFFPIICAMGTGNYLQVQILFFINTWFLFIYLVYAFSGFEKSDFNIPISILLIAITGKSIIDVFSGIALDPYKINGHLWEQTEALKMQASGETIFIDKELMSTIQKLKPLMESQNSDALFTSSELIGLSYVFNKKLIGYGWYDSGISPKEFFYQSYNQSALKEKNNICFMLLSAENNYKIFDYLNDKKINSKLVTLPWGNDSIFVYSRHN